MPSLFFSIRVQAPNNEKTIKNVLGNISYIATRIGVELNKPEAEQIFIDKLEKILLFDPLIEFFTHDEIKNLTDEDKLDLLVSELLTEEDLELCEGDYKIILLTMLKKLNHIFNRENQLHGLFGKLNNEFQDNPDLKKSMEYIEQKLRNGTIVYRSIISFSPENALMLGLDNQDAFKEILRKNILIIADKLDIPPSRLEYVAGVHIKKSNPHVHFTFWDKEQGVKKAWIDPKVSSNIRDNLIKSVYKEMFDNLYTMKNEARKILTDNTKIQFSEMSDFYMDLPEKKYIKEIKTAKKAFNPLGGFINNKYKPTFIKKYGKEYLEIMNQLPKKGRLNYEFLPPQLKKSVNETIKNLIRENEDFNREYNRFVNTAVDMAKMYSDNPIHHEEAKKKAEDDILKRMANQMLASMKEIKKYNSVVRKKLADKAYEKHLAIDITRSVFQMLLQNSHRIQNRRNELSQELSKQAKIEFYKKMESASGMDWERD